MSILREGEAEAKIDQQDSPEGTSILGALAIVVAAIHFEIEAAVALIGRESFRYPTCGSLGDQLFAVIEVDTDNCWVRESL